MLYVHIDEAKTPKFILGIDYYFDLYKKKEWFNDPYVKKMIKEVDNTIAVKDEYLESPIFGGMSPMQLSTGVKGLILMYETDKIIYGTRMGDNCNKFVFEMSNHKDIHVMLHHCMLPPDDAKFKAYFVDTGEFADNYDDFVQTYYRIRNATCENDKF